MDPGRDRSVRQLRVRVEASVDDAGLIQRAGGIADVLLDGLQTSRAEQPFRDIDERGGAVRSVADVD